MTMFYIEIFLVFTWKPPIFESERRKNSNELAVFRQNTATFFMEEKSCLELERVNRLFCLFFLGKLPAELLNKESQQINNCECQKQRQPVSKQSILFAWKWLVY